MRVYISGGITGVNDHEKRFSEAEQELLQLGHYVVNPCNIEVPEGVEKSWQNYMRADLLVMLTCEALYMLNNWRTSRGALLEHFIAITLGFKIIYQEG